jgi:two-component system sensor histidine kinase PilS (NtrC family)
MKLTQQPVHLFETPRRLLSWYLAIRLFMVCFFLGGTVVYQLQQQPWGASATARYLTFLTLLTVAQTFASGFLLRNLRRFRTFTNAQLSWDLLFITLVIFLTGGVESLYSFFFILIIIASGVFCPRPQVLVAASASSILYGSLLDLQYYGYLPLISGQTLARDISQSEVFYAVFLHVGAFFLTAVLSGALAERLRRSEAQREQREIDYGELEKLNREILTHIQSGLMVLNAEGRIRSFNNAASTITGFRLEEVYNRPVEAIFPEFADFVPGGDGYVERGEMSYRRDEDLVLTLGYSVSKGPYGRRGEGGGVLIAFQDLTEVKALEEQLQRADRLAAVGRLASGLAHEIRNPLASISGSVQLLLEDEQVREEDRRLMRIVVKEADRLSLLLSDFLNFARPAPLQPETVDLTALLDELVSLLRASPQFEGVELVRSYHAPVRMKVDPQKLHQVLWDVLVNAGEAVGGSGKVLIGVDAEARRIVIEDSGPGVADEDRDKLFEPFFTTKDRGTGLGLANAYANIEAHDGRIFVEPSSLGGARFTIELPKSCVESPLSPAPST